VANTILVLIKHHVIVVLEVNISLIQDIHIVLHVLVVITVLLVPRLTHLALVVITVRVVPVLILGAQLLVTIALLILPPRKHAQMANITLVLIKRDVIVALVVNITLPRHRLPA